MSERTQMLTPRESRGNTLDILIKDRKKIDGSRDYKEPFQRFKYRYGPESAFCFDQQYAFVFLYWRVTGHLATGSRDN